MPQVVLQATRAHCVRRCWARNGVGRTCFQDARAKSRAPVTQRVAAARGFKPQRPPPRPHDHACPSGERARRFPMCALTPHHVGALGSLTVEAVSGGGCTRPLHTKGAHPLRAVRRLEALVARAHRRAVGGAHAMPGAKVGARRHYGCHRAQRSHGQQPQQQGSCHAVSVGPGGACPLLPRPEPTRDGAMRLARALPPLVHAAERRIARRRKSTPTVVHGGAGGEGGEGGGVPTTLPWLTMRNRHGACRSILACPRPCRRLLAL
jgi:hypothetical protein